MPPDLSADAPLMSEPLHVLVYGPATAGICDFFRFGMHVQSLAEHGVELRPLTSFRYTVGAGYEGHAEDVVAADDFELDREDLDWADVLVFRRFYLTSWTCGICQLHGDRETLAAHATVSGHPVIAPDRLVRRLFDALERDPTILRGRAVVYETDDDILNIQPWNGLRHRTAPERDLIERMLRRADLVTVTTPVLAQAVRHFNSEVRVVRNAIDPHWYEASPEEQDRAAALEGDPRVLYYGLPVRIRDYAVARDAVDEAKRRRPALRRVWLGALDGPPNGGAAEVVLSAMDEVLPFVSGVPEFARALRAARPDIGLAPVVGDDFDRAKSELHWLEYSMVGAATVASRTMRGGPYDVIRDGVDGLVARSKADWRDALFRLSESPGLRQDLAGRARERVLAEYDVRVRAAEWAAAYRWAAEHAGRGVAGRVHGIGPLPAEAIESEARAALRHRVGRRTVVAGAPDRMGEARGGRAVCWRPEARSARAVSVVIPAVGVAPALAQRAVASALRQDEHAREIVVVADDAVRARLLEQVEPGERLRLIGLGSATGASFGLAGSRDPLGAALATGLLAATGDFVAPLAPEAEFTVDHLRTLLDAALEHELEFVYGQATVELAGTTPLTLGTWPPHPDAVLTLGSELFATALLRAVPPDGEAWRDGTTAGWSLWRDLAFAGVRMGYLETIVTRLVQLPATVAA